jgi:hypothetical protein
MAKLKSLQVNAEDYSIILKKYQKGNKKHYQLFSGSRKTLLNEKNKVVCSCVSSDSLFIGDIEKPYFFSFLGQFNKNLYKNLIQKDLIHYSVNFTGVSRKKNTKNFQCLEIGDFFYNVDLNSAYWQVAFNLGYIDEKLYLKFKDKEEYKSAKRLCISFLARQTRKTYYLPSGDFFTISCDNSVLKNVYQNIRKYLYSIFNEISQETKFIAYNIDSIYVTKKDLHIVKECLDELALSYKYVLCQKISNTEYSYGKNIRKF